MYAGPVRNAIGAAKGALPVLRESPDSLRAQIRCAAGSMLKRGKQGGRWAVRRMGQAGRRLACALLLALASPGVAASDVSAPDDRLRLYLDADFTHGPMVGQTIALGIRAALVHHGVADRFDLIVMDHRGNARRSADTIAIAAADPRAIAIFGGMNSPPYLSFNRELNAAGVPVLLPWSAGAPITRGATGADNWVFRVSVDDKQAGRFLARAAAARGCARPGIAALDGPWGTGNVIEIERHLRSAGTPIVGTWRLRKTLTRAQAAPIVQEIEAAAVDCLMLVSGSAQGVTILNSLAMLAAPPRVLSHWGLYGAVDLSDALRVPLARVNLAILGTCGLERAARDPTRARQAEAAATRVAGARVEVAMMTPPHGFFHAFDATTLLLQAIDQAQGEPGWAGGIAARRAAVRAALHAPDAPVEGLVARYDRPFSPASQANPDGHEALGADALCMQRLDGIGRLRPSLAGASHAGRSP